MKSYKIWLWGVFLVFGVACSQENEKMFDDQPTIYFNLKGVETDSILYSFAKTTAKEHVVEVPIEIAGYSAGRDRRFKIVADEKRTTAKPEKHFKALEEYYVLPAGKFTTKVPVTFYCTDPLLDSVAVDLYLQILPTEDFGNGLADRQEARIQVSNLLLMPKIWNAWWKRYFGPYSKTKHKLILEICKIDEIPDTNDGERFKWQGYGLTMLNYFKENYPVYDENGQIIEGWTVTY